MPNTTRAFFEPKQQDESRSRGNVARVGLVAAVLLAMVVGHGHGAEGRIPIFEPIVLNGATSDIDGSYVVTRNITASDTHIIRVINATGTERLNIDLNGFTLKVQSATAAYNVIDVEGVSSVEIHNGSVVPSGVVGSLGVRVINTEFAKVRDLTIVGGAGADVGIALGNVGSFRVERNEIHGADDAIRTGGSGSGVIRENRLKASDVYGIVVLREGIGGPVAVLSNTIESTGLKGILGRGQLDVTGNLIKDSGNIGIDVYDATGCRISRNIVSGSGSHGIRVGQTSSTTHSCHILENVATGNTLNGLLLDHGDDVLVQGNILSQNGLVGLRVDNSDRSVVLDNQMNGNASYGLRFDSTSDDATYGGNTMRGNTGGACGGGASCGGADCCDLGTGNTSFGDNLSPGPPPS